MSSFKLSSLLPQIVDVEIEAYGEKLVIPVMPLTFTQYQNVLIGLEQPAPEDYKTRKMVDDKMVEVVDRNNPEYLRANNNFIETVRMRRLALALAGGGVEELQGIDIEEQVNIVRGMDAGITNALMGFIEREARHRTATRFQPVSDDGNEDLPS